jgi:hypothetical protein
MSGNSISLNPSLPIELKEAYENGRLVIFIGAGVSRLMGLPSWSELADNLIQCAYNKSFIKISQIMNAALDSKQKITIAYKELMEQNKLPAFYKEFSRALEPKRGRGKKEKTISIYKQLLSLNTIFVTTNCDVLFENEIGKNLCSCQCTRETISTATAPYLFYIHGRYGKGTKEDKNTLIFTADKYIEKYNNTDFMGFMNTLFNEKTVLFIGYGANEMEILDYLMTRAKANVQQHYILEGFPSYLSTLQKAKRDYYETLNIKLIPYSMDEEGYDQQRKIITQWVDDLGKTTVHSMNILSSIETLIREYNECNLVRIENYIHIDNDKYVYSKAVADQINNSPNSIEWICALQKSGLLSPNNMCPKPYVEDSIYRFIRWYLFDALVTIFEKNRSNMILRKCAGETCIQCLYFINDEKNKNYLYNSSLIRAICKLILQGPEDFCSDEALTFFRSLKETNEYYFYIMLVDCDGFLSWSGSVFCKLISIFLSVLIETDDRKKTNIYELRMFFETHREKFSPEHAKCIIDTLCSLMVPINYRSVYLEHAKGLDVQVYKDEAASLLVDILSECLRKVSIDSAEDYIYTWINEKESMALSQIGMYTLQKNTSLELKIYRIKINPWDTNELLYDWYLCLSKHIKDVSSDDDLRKITGWIEESRFSRVYYPEEKALEERYINYRKWQAYEIISKEYNQYLVNRDKLFTADSNTIFDEIGEHTSKTGNHANEIPKVNETVFDNISTDLLVSEIHKYMDTNPDIDKMSIAKAFLHAANNAFIKGDNILGIFPQLHINLLVLILYEANHQIWYDERWDDKVIISLVSTLREFMNHVIDSEQQNVLLAIGYILQKYSTLTYEQCEMIQAVSLELLKNRDTAFIADERHVDDYMTRSLNCAEGIYCTLYVNCILKKERLNTNLKISDDDKQTVLKLLKNDQQMMFRSVLARNTQNLFYLNEDWATELIRRVFVIDNSPNIQLIAEGVMATKYIHKELIELIEDFNTISTCINSASANNQYYNHRESNILRYYIQACLVDADISKIDATIDAAKTNPRAQGSLADGIIMQIESKINEDQSLVKKAVGYLSKIAHNLGTISRDQYSHIIINNIIRLLEILDLNDSNIELFVYCIKQISYDLFNWDLIAKTCTKNIGTKSNLVYHILIAALPKAHIYDRSSFQVIKTFIMHYVSIGEIERSKEFVALLIYNAKIDTDQAKELRDILEGNENDEQF